MPSPPPHALLSPGQTRSLCFPSRANSLGAWTRLSSSLLGDRLGAGGVGGGSLQADTPCSGTFGGAALLSHEDSHSHTFAALVLAAPSRV